MEQIATQKRIWNIEEGTYPAADKDEQEGQRRYIEMEQIAPALNYAFSPSFF